ncbi:MAG: hypothetical protein RL638_900 [Bacteroidota bacterium]|jgi:hypothetical protein
MKYKIGLGALFIFSVCIALALATDHRWEDWYITFRASKNLALGNGLVFNIGEKVMTYTSPLGTLIPAFIKYLFIGYSDDYTMWIYRILCSFILSLSAYPIFKTIEYLKLNRLYYILGILLLSLSFIIIDNTINGMESAFMVFFEYALIYLILTKPSNYNLKIGLIFACFMFSRPDGFIYAGSIILGFLLFTQLPSIQLNKSNFRGLIISLTIAIFLFGPWLLWTWYYYGTPIPHTIIAKSKSYTFEYFLNSILNYINNFKGSADIYLAPYGENFGGWGIFETGARMLSILSLFYWVNWKGNSVARALSFATMCMIAYLNIVSGQGPAPWYLPAVAAPSALIILLALNDLNKVITSTLFYAIPTIVLIFLSTHFYYATRLIRNQQNIIEFGNRKQIGLWLNKNKGAHDTIFMECLGYIGFYSGLKTFDFPGMSSPEMVATRKKLRTNEYGRLIQELQPTWVIIRSIEKNNINNQVPNLLEKKYRLVKIFDKRLDIAHAKIKYGQPYLDFDAVFYLFKIVN